MDDLELKRDQVKKVYDNSVTWAHRVAAMSREQVIAIYLKFKREGKL